MNVAILSIGWFELEDAAWLKDLWAITLQMAERRMALGYDGVVLAV